MNRKHTDYVCLNIWDGNFFLTNYNLRTIFNTSFYTPNSSNMVKQLLQSCIICRLNRNVYKRSTSGEYREFQNDLTVGSIWCCDIAHLPRSKSGFKYVLLFSERLTSYICGIALKNITSATVSQAFKICMSIFPPLNIILTDFGPEFSRIWTTVCTRYGVSHENEIPKCSQQSGSAEISIKLLKHGLAQKIGLMLCQN